MRESVLSKIIKCSICKTAYIPENGEICKCERPPEEPRVRDWDDNPLVEALGHVRKKDD